MSETSAPRPIGVFDSGVGGLTVVAALERTLPGQAIVYLGDTARLPYGTKSERTVRHYTERNVRFLTERDVQAVVVACNTASALALSSVDCPVPIWGVVEPGAQRAAALSKGRVGVIATESTIASGAYERAIRTTRPELEVYSRACPLFVPLVEEGWHHDPITRQVAERYLEPLLAHGIDTLVLGCTHYPMLQPLLAELVGDAVTLVDSAEAVAEVVAADLPPLVGREHEPPRFFVTDAGDRFEQVAARFLERGSIHLELVEVS